MKLKEFILKLEIIKNVHGGNIEVTMADNLKVTNPIYAKKENKVFITDLE